MCQHCAQNTGSVQRKSAVVHRHRTATVKLLHKHIKRTVLNMDGKQGREGEERIEEKIRKRSKIQACCLREKQINYFLQRK